MYKYGITIAKGYGGFLSWGLQINLYLFPHSLKHTSVMANHEISYSSGFFLSIFSLQTPPSFERLSLAGDGLEAGSHFAIHLTGHTRLIFPFSPYFSAHSSFVDCPNIPTWMLGLFSVSD